MEKTADSVAAEIAALKHSLSEVTAAVNEYAELAVQNVGNKDVAASGSAVHTGCLRAVMEMSIFEALPIDGSPAAAANLAAKLGFEKEFLVRLMRNVTVLGPFAEVGKEKYAHTPYSQIFLVPGLQGFFKLIVDEWATVNAKLFEFFREHGFKSPDSELINPYCLAHQTGGKTMWEHLDRHPERLSVFNEAQRANGEANPWTVELFPFEENSKRSRKMTRQFC